MPFTCSAKILIWLAVAAYASLLFLRIILSWLPIQPPPWLRPAFNFLYDVTEPILQFFRGWLPSVNLGGMALDLSPILAFVVLYIVQRILEGVLFPC